VTEATATAMKNIQHGTGTRVWCNDKCCEKKTIPKRRDAKTDHSDGLWCSAT